mgnify:CR=1 FL=1
MNNADVKEPQPKVDNLFLDCGARNKKEVEALGIHIGAVATYEEGYDELANGFLIGRAFDNRIGGFMIAEVARLIKESKKKSIRNETVCQFHIDHQYENCENYWLLTEHRFSK